MLPPIRISFLHEIGPIGFERGLLDLEEMASVADELDA